ncbi:MAG: hypothetical protein ACKVHE_34545 [Planctomycetales bacterium]
MKTLTRVASVADCFRKSPWHYLPTSASAPYPPKAIAPYRDPRCGDAPESDPRLAILAYADSA